MKEINLLIIEDNLLLRNGEERSPKVYSIENKIFLSLPTYLVFELYLSKQA